jgi:hypothetical protein
MNVVIVVPTLWKMMKACNQIEDFAHFNVLEKYKADVALLENEGYIEIKPRVLSYKRVHRAHNLKLDCMDEPF